MLSGRVKAMLNWAGNIGACQQATERAELRAVMQLSSILQVQCSRLQLSRTFGCRTGQMAKMAPSIDSIRGGTVSLSRIPHMTEFQYHLPLLHRF